MRRPQPTNPIVTMALVIGSLIVGCGKSDGPHKPIPAQNATMGKDAANDTTAPITEAVTYADVRPLFETYCSRCHPNIMPPDWLQYENALEYVQNGKLHQRVIEEKTMPLPGTPEAQMMSREERELIAQWILSGGAE